MKQFRVVLGDQLFAEEHLPEPGSCVYLMAEDVGLCTTVKHHQQKLVLFLSAMRHYRDFLRSRGDTVMYRELLHSHTETLYDYFSKMIKAEAKDFDHEQVTISYVRPSDPAVRTAFQRWSASLGDGIRLHIKCAELANPNFLHPSR